MLARFLQFIPTARDSSSIRVMRMVVTGVVMVIVVMVMARESWHGDHDHRDEKQRQQHLFHGRIITMIPGPSTRRKAKRTMFANRNSQRCLGQVWLPRGRHH
jgi:hypothetical protein